MRTLHELVLGRPETLDGPALARVLRRGDAALRLRAARALTIRPEREAQEQLAAFVADWSPGVRRTVAHGLGWTGDAGWRGLLEERASVERCTTVRVALAAAIARLGGAPEPVIAGVGVLMHTSGGPRTPENAVGMGIGDGAAALRQILDPRQAGATAERDGLRTALAARHARDPNGGGGRQALEDLGAQSDPRDFERILDARRAGGKRSENSVLIALGLNGDPRALPLLEKNLARMDVDPGRGFALRRLSALSIGRIGLATPQSALIRALEVEALEHEGRPGAGLGIQYPVRGLLLWALGELQAPVPELLAGYLDSLDGSALGGFHLPAMGALYKLGAVAVPTLVQVAQHGPTVDARVNAVGVLEALGAREGLEAVGSESAITALGRL